MSQGFSIAFLKSVKTVTDGNGPYNEDDDLLSPDTRVVFLHEDLTVPEKPIRYCVRAEVRPEFLWC